jgi:hypothetical protein
MNIDLVGSNVIRKWLQVRSVECKGKSVLWGDKWGIE